MTKEKLAENGLSQINQLIKDAHENAVSKGWYEKEPKVLELIALCHCELSEAAEEYRDGKPDLYFPCNSRHLCDKDSCASKLNPSNPDYCSAQSLKPEGIAVELADCVIRIFDMCGFLNIDLEKAITTKMAYNKTRPYRHGGKVM